MVHLEENYSEPTTNTKCWQPRTTLLPSIHENEVHEADKLHPHKSIKTLVPPT